MPRLSAHASVPLEPVGGSRPVPRPADRATVRARLHRPTPSAGIAGPGGPLVEPLNEREHAVLRLPAAGLSNRPIAAQSGVALSTVKWYLSKLHSRLSESSRTPALARAGQWACR